MARQWGERQPNGSVDVYQEDDQGNVTLLRNEPYDVNQGGGSGAGQQPPAGGQPASPWKHNPGGGWYTDGGGYVDSTGQLQTPDPGGAQPPAEAATPGGAGPTSGPGSANGPGGAQPGTGGGTYQTHNGPKTLQQMIDELHHAGYGGPVDEATVLAKYAQTTGGQITPPSGGTVGGNNGGIDDIVNGQAQYNQQYYDIAKAKNDADIRNIDAQIADAQARLKIAQSADDRASALMQLQDAQFNKNLALQQSQFLENQRQFNIQQGVNNQNTTRGQYANFAGSLLDAASRMNQPGDWDRYLTYTNQGKDVLSSLFGGQGRPDVEASAAQGPGGKASVADLLGRLGIDFSQLNKPLGSLDQPTPTQITPTQVATGTNAPDYGRAFADTYNQLSRERGGQPIPANDPEYAQRVAAATGLDPATVARVAQTGRDWAVSHNGQGIPNDEVNRVVAGYQGMGQGGQQRIGPIEGPGMQRYAGDRQDWASQLDQMYAQQQAANGGSQPTRDQVAAMYQQIGLNPQDAQAAVDFGAHSYQTTGGGAQHNQNVNDFVSGKINGYATNQPDQLLVGATPMGARGAGQPLNADPGTVAASPVPQRTGTSDANPIARRMVASMGSGAPPMNPVQRTQERQANLISRIQNPGTGPGPAQLAQRGTGTPGSVGMPTFGGAITQAANPSLLRPWQVNPAEWDRATANPSAKARLQGYLGAQGEDPTTYEAEINKTRPSSSQGFGTQTQYRQPAGVY